MISVVELSISDVIPHGAQPVKEKPVKKSSKLEKDSKRRKHKKEKDRRTRDHETPSQSLAESSMAAALYSSSQTSVPEHPAPVQVNTRPNRESKRDLKEKSPKREAKHQTLGKIYKVEFNKNR